jgi:hypothetical protein
MSIRHRTRLALALAVVLVVAFAAFLFHQMSLRRTAAIDSAVRFGPLTVFASEEGGYTTRGDWQLKVDPFGNATLQIQVNTTRKTRRFVVPKTHLDDLRKALLQERFFDLSDSYGQTVADDSVTTIQITAGDFTKNVELKFIGNWIQSERARLREPSRALRVSQIIRDWFNDPEAIDSRKYDQLVIDAAGRS